MTIPAQSAWTDYGTIFELGALGEWDYQLGGAFGGAVVKKDGVFYLYYQGASGYRIVDDSVTWRTVGAATSPDGINFTKYAGNPVLSWFPNNNGEEGAVSTAALLDPGGEIVVYYGANTEESATTVNADGRIAAASDGLALIDEGIALSHGDPSLWGSGDELFPVAAFLDSGQWTVYYIPNGTPQKRTLGVAWGAARDQLTSSAGATSGGSAVAAWGMAGIAPLGAGTWALFVNDVRVPRIEARTLSTATPHQLSAPVETYTFPDVRQATVYLDGPADTWFLYYRSLDQRRYGVMLAPVGAADTSPPTTPPNVVATSSRHDTVDLTWDPATDPDTGIVQYRIFRDGQPVATVKGWGWTDTGLVESTGYSYEVSAVNYHGTEGPRSPPAAVVTPADTTPPQIASVSAAGSPTQVRVVFDEPVQTASAEDPDNYQIVPGLPVTAASLGADLATVTLDTGTHLEARTYQLTVGGVRDRSPNANPIPAPVVWSYTFSSSADLAACWRFEEGSGTLTADTANFGSEASLLYPSGGPAVWTTGRIGSGLDFDGLDDLATIPGNGVLDDLTASGFTFAAWVRPLDVPPDTAFNNTYYTILSRRYAGLYYDLAQRFNARLPMEGGGVEIVLSATYAPGSWHHVAMTVDLVASQMRLYVDGVEVAGSPLSYSGTPQDSGGEEYYVGTSDPLVERWDYRFKGALDEPRIFRRALSAPEIQMLAQLCIGDDATGDTDGDGVCDDTDACPGSDDAFDGDADAVPDGCDLCLGDDATGDTDSDGVCDDLDLCLGNDGTGDTDGDGVCDDTDACPGSDDALDGDGDGVPDGCDLCLGDDATGDTDADGVCDDTDLCPGFDDALDADGDGVPDGCDLCLGNDTTGDTDSDGVCDDTDLCPGSDDSLDADADGVPDGCDLCLGDDATGDTDADGVCDDSDLCPGFDDALDADGDGVPDGCDDWYLLTVSRTGAGRVTALPGGIDCGADCDEAYPGGTPVVLDTVPLGGSDFGGWDGDADCGDGLLTMTGDRVCVATFLCPSDSELTVSGVEVTGTVTHQHCDRVVVGPGVTVRGGGVAVFRAPGSVVFESVTVDADGELTVELAPPR